MSSPNPPVLRQLQMDGLRAFALLFVLVHHFGEPVLNRLNLGPFGVRFFFVVSGFLVTRTLLKARHRMNAGHTSAWQELSTFQMRRLLRTMPAYYLSLLVAAAIGIPPVRESIFWTLTYLTNFYIASIGYFPATISHFWTLAVQEQFYFFWPLILFFLPKSWIVFTFPILVLTSLLFRYFCIESDVSYIVRWFNLLGNLDTFATGGYLAWLAQRHPLLLVDKWTRLWSGWLAVVALLIAIFLRTLSPDNPWSIFIELLESCVMGWLVACSVTGFHDWTGRILAWRPLTYLGQISYGVYVYHVLISILVLPLFVQLGLAGGGTVSLGIRFAVLSLLSIVVAALSWHCFEQPLLSARERMARWTSPNSASNAG